MVGLDSKINKMKGNADASMQNGIRPATNGAAGILEAKSNSPTTAGPTPPSVQPGRETSKDIVQGDVARKIKQEYTRARKESGMRGLDSIHGLIKQLMEEQPDIDEVLKSTAKTIYSQFNIKEVSIGLRHSDGLYRYVAMYGLRDEVWAAHRKLAYDEKQLMDPNTYKWTEISHHTKLFLAEDDPYTVGEALTRSEHLSMKSKRKTAEDSIEGDYMDVFIYGPKDEILGWIEFAGTWDGKIPDALTIRSLEIVSSVLALAIMRHPPKQA